MSKFSQKETPTKTVNLAGGEAYSMSPKLEFISLIVNSFVKSQFYRSEEDSVSKIKELVSKLDKKFVAKAAIFVRNKFGMRSVSHVIAGELAKIVKKETWLRSFFTKVVYRVDDITEILAYYITNFKKPIPNALKRGLAKAFDRFDRYQLAKYKGKGKSMSLIDAVNLIHPKPTEKNKEALSDLVKGKLVSTDTWEAKLSDAGKKAEGDESKLSELKADAWKELISTKKIGYFALLRNLRNIEQQAPDMIPEACELLTDRKLIKSSLVLPFRFQTAINEVTDRKLITAISQAVEISVDNVPKLSGRTLVVLDVSRSMEGKTGEIAALFASVLYKSQDSDMIVFDDSARYVAVNPIDSVLTISKALRSAMRGSGTNFHTIFRCADKQYDRVIILSDMQGWIGYSTPVKEFNGYKTRVNCNPKVYSWDLSGYGSLQFPEQNIFCLAGFSEKVFDLMGMLEQDKDALISEIEKIEL